MSERGPFKPSYWLDEDMAALSLWCRLHGYTCHVKLGGTHVELRRKPIIPQRFLFRNPYR